MKDINGAFEVMGAVLAGNNTCSQFFGAGGPMALGALQSVTTVGVVNDPDTGRPSRDIGIATEFGSTVSSSYVTGGEYLVPNSMTVNSVGMFFHGRDLGSPTATVRSDSREGQSIQVAHEIAHSARKGHRSLIVYDGPAFGRLGPVLSMLSTARIINQCLPAIRETILRRQYPGTFALGAPPR
jgi:hypothetical protein